MYRLYKKYLTKYKTINQQMSVVSEYMSKKFYISSLHLTFVIICKYILLIVIPIFPYLSFVSPVASNILYGISMYCHIVICVTPNFGEILSIAFVV